MANNNKRHKEETAHIILSLLPSLSAFPLSLPHLLFLCCYIFIFVSILSLHSWHRGLAIQWPLFRTLESQLSSTYLVHLPSCWHSLSLEFSPSTTGSTSPNGIFLEEEPAQGAPGILWASLWISIFGLTSLSWTGCLRLWEWVKLRLFSMPVLTLLFSSEFTFLGIPFSSQVPFFISFFYILLSRTVSIMGISVNSHKFFGILYFFWTLNPDN